MNKISKTALPFHEVYQDSYCRVSSVSPYFAVYQYYEQLPQSRDLLLPSMKVVLTQARFWSSRGIRVFYWLEIKEGEFLPSEDITWVRKDVIPQLVNAGIRYVAYVSKNSLFRQFSHDTILDEEQSQALSLRIFKETQDALGWLTQVRSQL